MKRKLLLNLHLFDGDGGEGGDGAERKTGTYTYEQVEQIANARSDRAEKAAVKSFFKQKGLTEEEANTAFDNFLKEKEKRQPKVSEVERERDDALKKLNDYKNTDYLRSKGVKEEFMEYVAFTVGKSVDDKTDF